MPIIVVPGTPPPPPPLIATSPDGLLTAQYDPNYAGVLLSANLSGYASDNLIGFGGNNIAAHIPLPNNAWTVLYSGTTAGLAVTTGSTGAPSPYIRYLILDSTTLNRSYLGLSQRVFIQKGRHASVSFFVRASGAEQVRVDLVHNGVVFRSISRDFVAGGGTAGTWTQYTFDLSTTIPGDKDIDELRFTARWISNPAPMILHLAGFVAPLAPPDQIQFERTNEGLMVRGGDSTWSPGGKAKTYDHEAPLGLSSTWVARPVYQGVPRLDQTSQGVSLTMPEPAGGPGDPSTWIKPTELPGDAIQVMINAWPDVAITVYGSTTHIPGRKKSLGQFDTVGGFSGDVKVITRSPAQEAHLERAIATGFVLLQVASRFRRPSMFAMVTGAVRSDFTQMDQDDKIWTLSLDEVDRPDTLDQPSRMPGRSFADRLAAHPTFADVPARVFGDGMTIV